MASELNDDNFGESRAVRAVKAFDAFPKVKQTYVTQTDTGGIFTIILTIASIFLAGTEIARWLKGNTTHEFNVQSGIGHDFQINVDLITKMRCGDLHVNIQDSTGDRILGSSALKKEDTIWTQWSETHQLGATKADRGIDTEYKEQDVHDFLHAVRNRGRFRKTPRLRSEADSCRIFGSIESTMVSGDFHITVRNHGYMDAGPHLDHQAFNLSHKINELSFGPHYPSLINPLDNTVAATEHHFHKFQYYLSVVPTVYTTDAHALRSMVDKHESPSSGQDGLKQHRKRYAKDTVFTNQYAVTEQSYQINEQQVPGIFIKYDIEPIVLTIAEEWASIPSLFIRLVNVISGVLVAGGWLYTMSEWAKDMRAKGRRQATTYDGILNSKAPDYSNGDMDKKHGY